MREEDNMVMQIIAEIMEVDVADMSSDLTLYDLGADELDMVEVTLALEQAMDIEFPDSRLLISPEKEASFTVGDVIKFASEYYCAPRSDYFCTHLLILLTLFSASTSFLPGRKRATSFPGITIDSPVWGLVPALGCLTLVLKVPNPTIVNFFPSNNPSFIASKVADIARSVCFLVRSDFSATKSTSSFFVRLDFMVYYKSGCKF